MTKQPDNYQIQAMQAKKRFLTYDQQELIQRCALRYDAEYLYLSMLSEPYRIHRSTGDMDRFSGGVWIDGNSYNEVMTILDWLCDSRRDRYISGRWINIVTHGHYFHGNLQDGVHNSYATLFDRDPEGFASACEALRGEKLPGADIGYAIELLDGLRIFVQLWHADEEFPPNLRCLWDENTDRYLRYETTWFAIGLLMQRIKENMNKGANK